MKTPQISQLQNTIELLTTQLTQKENRIQALREKFQLLSKALMNQSKETEQECSMYSALMRSNEEKDLKIKELKFEIECLKKDNKPLICKSCDGEHGTDYTCLAFWKERAKAFQDVINELRDENTLREYKSEE